MFNELTMDVPSNVVTTEQLASLQNRSLALVGRIAASIKNFFSLERFVQIIATAAILDVMLLLVVLNLLTVPGWTHFLQYLQM